MNNLTTALTIYVASAALYAFIGYSLGKKSFSAPSDVAAWRAFRIWWFGMALNNVINIISLLSFSAGITAVPLFVTFSVSSTLVAAAALWGLITYLLYIFTGGNRGAKLVAGFYIAFALFLFYSIYAFQPNGVALGEWQVAIQYANAPTGSALILYAISFLLLISLPPVLASIGMFTLFFRVKERSSKYRAALVPLGIFMLFGIAYLIPLALYPFGIRTGDLPWWSLMVRLVGLAGLLLIYWAYYPPAFLQKSLRVAPLT